MIRSLLFASLVVVTACSQAHLGPDTNVAYREAFAAQRESEPKHSPEFGADDARATNAARRGEKPKAAAPAPSGGGSLMPIAPISTSGGAWQGAKGNMSLEAK